MATLISKRTFRIPVPTANGLFSKEFELPSDVQVVTGLAITADRRDLAWKRGTVGLTIAGQELIVEGEDAAEYMYGSNHPARTWAFGELPVAASDRRMQVRYTDTDEPDAAFSTYTVKIVVSYQKITR